MTAAVDIRAKVYCSLGPVISGSLSDTYAQGAGLIFTRGSVEINRIIRPAVGTSVQLAYQKNGLLTRLPRSLVVLSSFADPFRGKTTVQLGCRLTFLENRKPLPEDQTVKSKEENGDVPCSVFERATLSISAGFVLGKITQALGINGNFPSLTNKFTTEEFDLSSGYVSVLGNLLVSECYVGYMNSADQFTFKNLSGLPGSGPLLDGRNIIDISPIGSGDLPGDSALVRYSSKKLKAPEDDETDEEAAKRSWEWEEIIGAPVTSIVTWIDDGGVEPEEESYTVMIKPYTFMATTYDQWDRAVERITWEDTPLPEMNSRYASDIMYVYNGIYPGLLFFSVPKISWTKWTYKIPPEGGTSQISLRNAFTPGEGGVRGTQGIKAAFEASRTAEASKTALECLEESVDIDPEELSIVLEEYNQTYITELELAGTLNLDGYRWLVLETSNVWRLFELSFLPDILESTTKIVYEKDAPSGITKTKTFRTVLRSKTTVGQQDIAKRIKDEIEQDEEGVNGLTRWLPEILLDAAQQRVEGPEIKIRTEREYGIQKRPAQGDRNTNYNSKDIPIEDVSEFEWASGTASDNFVEFSLPYAPDDDISWTEEGGYTSTTSDAKTKALNYGRVQNRLLLGNRNGVSIQVPADVMPPYPLDPIYLSAAGLTGAYLLNGTTFTFDANGLIGSADCLFWGAVA